MLSIKKIIDQKGEWWSKIILRKDKKKFNIEFSMSFELLKVSPLVCIVHLHWGFPGGSVVKIPPANAGDTENMGSIPESGRCPGGENDNPLQYSYL